MKFVHTLCGLVCIVSAVFLLSACGDDEAADSHKENTKELCQDGRDNDHNGKTDCEDPDCQDFAVCTGVVTAENTEAACKDGEDNDKDGFIDCRDTDCMGFAVCKENTYTACKDGIDNDNDGDADCDDTECQQFSICSWGDSLGPENTEQRCHDNLDNDDNGLTDCFDSGCIEFCPVDDDPEIGEKSEEECQDDLDNDRDNMIDCADKGCQTYDFCLYGGASGENTVEKCRDGLDDDKDGYEDCNDPECQVFRFCNLGKYKNPQDVECLEAIDNGETCESSVCANAPVCQTHTICSLELEPRAYERGECECGYSISQLLVDKLGEGLDPKEYCAFNLNNKNIVKYIRSNAATSAERIPSKLILEENIQLGTQKLWNGFNGNADDSGTFKNGYFDGNGKKISGTLTCDETTQNCGLFTEVEGSVFSNFDIMLSLSGTMTVGGIAGKATDSEFSGIKSSSQLLAKKAQKNNGSNDYSAISGGIVGYAKNCIFDNLNLEGSVSADSEPEKSSSFAGGVVGISEQSELSNIESIATISANHSSSLNTQVIKSCAGGIVGMLYSGNTTIKNVKVNAVVSSVGHGMGQTVVSGGIVGELPYIQSATIYNNNVELSKSFGEPKPVQAELLNVRSSGRVTGQNRHDESGDVRVGGIGGSFESVEKSLISGAYSDAEVICQSGDEFTSSSLVGFNIHFCNAGGILGYDFNTNIRSASYNGTMDVTANCKAYLGGIIGRMHNSYISNSSATGALTLHANSNFLTEDFTHFLGGIAGAMEHEATGKSYVYNSYNHFGIIISDIGPERFQPLPIRAGAVTGYATIDSVLYSVYYTLDILPEYLNGTYAPGIVPEVFAITTDISCKKYDSSENHLLEQETNRPMLFDHLRYNVGDPAVDGVASRVLPYAEDYCSWKLAQDPSGNTWPVIDLDSEQRYTAGSQL